MADPEKRKPEWAVRISVAICIVVFVIKSPPQTTLVEGVLWAEAIYAIFLIGGGIALVWKVLREGID